MVSRFDKRYVHCLSCSLSIHSAYLPQNNKYKYGGMVLLIQHIYIYWNWIPIVYQILWYFHSLSAKESKIHWSFRTKLFSILALNFPLWLIGIMCSETIKYYRPGFSRCLLPISDCLLDDGWRYKTIVINYVTGKYHPDTAFSVIYKINVSHFNICRWTTFLFFVTIP